MEDTTNREDAISKLMADEYAGRILSTTHKRPLSVQYLSKICGIPIAVAYRRVGRMEEVGLLKCVRQEEVFRGKKVKYYQCAVRVLKFIFVEGRFGIEVEWLPEEEFLVIPEPIGEKA